jgi:hypothetical protein
MKHLNDAEFVDLIEGELDAARVSHVDSCTACRDKAASLSAVRDEALDWPAARPSPLFWDHFASRVSDAIAQQPEPVAPPRWTAWRRNPAVTWAVAASVAVLLMVGALWRATILAPVHMPSSQVASTSESEHGAPGNDVDDLDRVEAWVGLRSAAGDAVWEDVVGNAARPGSAERVVLELSNEERAELARLLEHELKRSGV